MYKEGKQMQKQRHIAPSDDNKQCLNTWKQQSDKKT